MPRQRRVLQCRNRESPCSTQIQRRLQPRWLLERVLEAQRILREDTPINCEQVHAIWIVPAQLVYAVGLLQDLLIGSEPPSLATRRIFIQRLGLIDRQLDT